MQFCESKAREHTHLSFNATHLSPYPEPFNSATSLVILLSGAHMMLFWTHNSPSLYLLSSLLLTNGVSSFLAHYLGHDAWNGGFSFIDGGSMLFAAYVLLNFLLEDLSYDSSKMMTPPKSTKRKVFPPSKTGRTTPSHNTTNPWNINQTDLPPPHRPPPPLPPHLLNTRGYEADEEVPSKRRRFSLERAARRAERLSSSRLAMRLPPSVTWSCSMFLLWYSFSTMRAYPPPSHFSFEVMFAIPLCLSFLQGFLLLRRPRCKLVPPKVHSEVKRRFLSGSLLCSVGVAFWAVTEQLCHPSHNKVHHLQGHALWHVCMGLGVPNCLLHALSQRVDDYNHIPSLDPHTNFPPLKAYFWILPRMTMEESGRRVCPSRTMEEGKAVVKT